MPNKLLQSRECRAELLLLLKTVIEEIETGLTEDDVAFEKFLIGIKETDRVVNNAVLCNQILGGDDILLFQDKDSVTAGISRLKEQIDFITDNIRDFENLQV